MKKILNYLLSQLKYFFINPFWTKIAILALIFISLLLNGVIWYWYFVSFKGFISLTPVGYISATLGLNIFLANIIYPKQTLISYILLTAALFIQILSFFFFRIFTSGGIF